MVYWITKSGEVGCPYSLSHQLRNSKPYWCDGRRRRSPRHVPHAVPSTTMTRKGPGWNICTTPSFALVRSKFIANLWYPAELVIRRQFRWLLIVLIYAINFDSPLMHSVWTASTHSTKSESSLPQRLMDRSNALSPIASTFDQIIDIEDAFCNYECKYNFVCKCKCNFF